ncbi:OB-fold putative lipoprotein, partial [Klebsiella pneumoniae]|uniref:OB-fold putative lipoprotein n=1 Tax=Klebsiella pneumoniae TaxID=573 RepID=UPI0021640BD2
VRNAGQPCRPVARLCITLPSDRRVQKNLTTTKTDKRLTFNFGSHNSADVEALSNGSVATIVGQVHQVQDSTIPTLQNPKVVK